MISSSKWGSITWILLHSILDINISNEQFKIIKNELYSLIKNICITSPLQSAKELFIIYFKNINLGKIISVIQLKNVLFLFHNFINSKINKPLFPYNKLSIYSYKNINRVFQEYNNIYFDKNALGITLYDPNRFITRHAQMFISKNNIFFDNLFIKDINPIIAPDIIAPDIIAPDIIAPDIIAPDIIAPDISPIVIKDVIKDDIKDVIKNNADKYSIYKNISVIDDAFLPSFELSLPEAMIELKKNPKCIPFDAYLERWKYFYNKKTRMQKSYIKEVPKINDDLLPELTLSLQIALQKIKSNPKCVPSELYFKRWNELKLLNKHKFIK
jgi:hypothetical protein